MNAKSIDRRTGGDQPDHGHGPADGNFGAGPRNPGGRDDGRRRGWRLPQDRRHRGLRAGRLRPHVAKPQRGSSVHEGLFRKDEFRFDAGLDAYVCPAGKLLTPIRRGRMRDLERTDYGNPKACRACQLRPRCTNDARSVFRLENEDVLDRMAERLRARPAILDRRREVVEHPFGSIKQWMYQGAFLMRGLANVRAEFSLTALAYNLRRALNILGVEAMTAAVAA